MYIAVKFSAVMLLFLLAFFLSEIGIAFITAALWTISQKLVCC